MQLSPGSNARIYRDGAGEPVGMFEVPRDGSPLVIRHLAPGSYEARDETGKTHRFHVHPLEEAVEIGEDARSVPKDEIAPDARSVPGAAGSALELEVGDEVVGAPGDKTDQGVREAVLELEKGEQRLHGQAVHPDAGDDDSDGDEADEKHE